MSKTIEAKLAEELSTAFAESEAVETYGYVQFWSTYCERYNARKGGWTPYYRFHAGERHINITAGLVIAYLRRDIEYFEDPSNANQMEHLKNQKFKFEIRIGEKKRKFWTPYEALDYIQSQRRN